MQLDHRRPSHVTETEFVSQMLTKVKRFAQHYDVHVWLVAHPRQLQDWKGEAPNLYDVSGRCVGGACAFVCTVCMTQRHDVLAGGC